MMQEVVAVTVAMSLEQRRLDRAETGKTPCVARSRRCPARSAAGVGGQRLSMDPLPDSESLLPLPRIAGRTAPNVVARGGTVAVLFRRPIAVAEHGGGGGRRRADTAAIVGQPDVGLLAAVEMGAELSRDRGHPRTRCRSGRGGRRG